MRENVIGFFYCVIGFGKIGGIGCVISEYGGFDKKEDCGEWYVE